MVPWGWRYLFQLWMLKPAPLFCSEKANLGHDQVEASKASLNKLWTNTTGFTPKIGLHQTALTAFFL